MIPMRWNAATLAIFATLAASPVGAQTDSAGRIGLPLQAARAARFTTTQGTWMSVDVSPDGQTIVFDLLGDLYTLPIAGGTATRLTSGLAFDAQPRWSPDGRRIAFISDRSGGDNLWILDPATGDTTQITHGNEHLYHSPEWTPDGQYLVASKSGGLGGAAKLWMYHVQGGSGTALIKEPTNLKTLGAAFGPDPRYLWYAARTGDWQYNAILPQYQLAIYDRQTGTTTTMSGRYGSAFRPALSPDGKWLAYGSRHDIQTGLRIRDLATSDERWLAWPVQRDDQESRAPLDVLPGFSFTPDSRAVVASYGGEIWRIPIDGSAATKIPFTANVDLAIGPEVKFTYPIEDTPTFTARQIRDVAPSPDDRRLAFSALDKLWIVDLPNGTPRRVTRGTDGEFAPTWSPDGQWVAYVTWNDRAGGQIWKARADGRGQPQQLTQSAALYSETAWAPDGHRIVAVVAAARDLQEAVGGFGGGLGQRFVWVPAAGGAVTEIAPAGGLGGPHFTADTMRIFASSRGQGLVSMRWDGTDRRNHLRVRGAPPPGATDPHDPATYLHLEDGTLEPTPPGPPASALLMSPVSGRALAQVGSDLYVVTVPVVGGDVPTVSVADSADALVPFRRLTDIGGEFPVWSADGRRVHWAIGNAFVTYDLDRGRAVDDSLRAAWRTLPDSATRDTSARYHPTEQRVVVTAARDRPSGIVVLHGGRAITMRGHEIIENADVLIRDNRIAAIGPAGQVAIPAGADTIDVTGKTLLPGFVDLHYHPQWLIPDIHTNQVWHYVNNLAYGVTTTRDPQTGSTDVLTYGDRVTMGELVGPRIYSTGPGVFSGERIGSLEHARNVLKRYSAYWNTKTFKMYMSGNRQQRQWLIMAARELGLMPTTEGGLDAKLDFTHVMDGYPGVEHAIPITPMYRDVVEMFKASQTTNTPTLLVSYGGPFGENYWYTNTEVHDDAKLRRFTPEEEIDGKTRRRGNNPGPGGWFRSEEYVFSRHAQFIRDLIEGGARAGIGSHGQLQGLGYHWELWSMATGGLSTHDVLRMATIYGAEAIGLGSELGSLEPGKFADLQVLDRNPLESIRFTTGIQYVMKNGRLYRGETMDEVWPRQRAMPPQPWQEQAPTTTAGIRRTRTPQTQLEALADDSMMGRLTGTEGTRMASRFIAGELERAGVLPGGSEGYFQPIPLSRVTDTTGRQRLTLLPSFADLDTIPEERRASDRNVIGIIHGTDPVLADEVVVVAAHYDHIGIRPAVNGDSIANGADDDASGVVAVLQIGRALAAGPPPKRTVVLLLSTGEERGLLGTRYYLNHPVRPLERTVAQFEVEMIGRPDSLAGGPGKAWLTGYERSTMGDMLKAAGVPIVADPRPTQRFFQRSDNIAFARIGIPAHTLSSFNLHTDYHQVSDEADRADPAHMAKVIDAAIQAVRILADGPKPEWHPGGRPTAPIRR